MKRLNRLMSNIGLPTKMMLLCCSSEFTRVNNQMCLLLDWARALAAQVRSTGADGWPCQGEGIVGNAMAFPFFSNCMSVHCQVSDLVKELRVARPTALACVRPGGFDPRL